jgi:hypothetical protein
VTCIACGSEDLQALIEVPSVPVFCNQLCSARDVALAAPVAPLELVYCRSCEHLFNAGFDAALLEYSPEYENSLHHSARFQEYADALSARLRERLALRGKVVVEVGCGSGDFLMSLCTDPTTRGFGFDRSYPGDGVVKPPENVRIRAEFFGAEHAALRPEFLCTRHVLEHVESPRRWLSGLREALAVGTDVYVEVPSSLFTMRDGGIWDLIYEHPSYFSPRSVAQVVTQSGFEVLEVEESFEGQFLSVYARATERSAEPSASLPSAEPHVEGFREGYRSKVDTWRRQLEEWAAQGQKVVIWGAGSKGNTFLNVLAKGAEVELAVDVNPRKHGRFVVGTGQEIVGPERLRSVRPDVVVVMNPAYQREIEATLGELGLAARTVAA